MDEPEIVLVQVAIINDEIAVSENWLHIDDEVEVVHIINIADALDMMDEVVDEHEVDVLLRYAHDEMDVHDNEITDDVIINGHEEVVDDIVVLDVLQQLLLADEHDDVDIIVVYHEKVIGMRADEVVVHAVLEQHEYVDDEVEVVQLLELVEDDVLPLHTEVDDDEVEMVENVALEVDANEYLLLDTQLLVTIM